MKQPIGVINASLGGGGSRALDLGFERAVQAGYTCVVAAGNENQDARNVSPARADGVITVAASTEQDTPASFSNHGPRVDLYAPGSNIVGAKHNGENANEYVALSGTSMAVPLVAGLLACVQLTPRDALEVYVHPRTITQNRANTVDGRLSCSVYV